MIVSGKESTSLSVNVFEDLDMIVTKEASCNTDASDGFTTDRKQKCSNIDSVVVIALKEYKDSLKQQLRDKQFITESLLANLQHHSYSTSLSNENQILVKKQEDNIDLLCPAEIHLNQLKKLQNQLKIRNKVFKLIKEHW